MLFFFSGSGIGEKGMVCDLHGLSCNVQHSSGWGFRTFFFFLFLEIVTKTINLSIVDRHLECFSVPSLNDCLERQG